MTDPVGQAPAPPPVTRPAVVRFPRRAPWVGIVLLALAACAAPLLWRPDGSTPRYGDQLRLAVLAISLVVVFRRRRGWARRLGAWLAIAGVATAMTLLLGAAASDAVHHGRGGVLEGIGWRDTARLAAQLAGLLLALAGLDAAVKGGLRRLLSVRPDAPWSTGLAGRRAVIAAARLIVFWLVGVSWLFAFLETHRPKIGYSQRPHIAHTALPRDADLPAAWLIPADPPSDTTVVLCHGIGANQSNMLWAAHVFGDLGCNAVTFDLPGHGRGDGLRTTFGLDESAALLRVARWVRDHPPAGTDPARHRVVGFGQSLGGTTVLLAAQREPDLFDGLIVDSAFATLESVAQDRLAMLPWLLRWPLDRTGRFFVAMEIGAPVAAVDATRRMGRLDGVPKLFLHCRDDPLVPFAESAALYRAAGEPKRLIAFTAGGHLGGLSGPNHARSIGQLRMFLQSIQPPDHDR